jgi:peptidoglycan hydrolase-like protein with peptidoglycan-binding domain
VIIGPDEASVDGNDPPDWAALKAACKAAGSSLGFAFFRGAWGTWPDPVLDQHWVAAKRAGLTVGAYLYLRMTNSEPPEDQVHAFADHVGMLNADDFVPALDIEDSGFPPEKALEWSTRAWEELYKIYGALPIVYLSARVVTEVLGGLPLGPLTDSPLWVAKPWPWKERTQAHLVYDGAPDVPAQWELGGQENYWFYQYQGDAMPCPGFSSTVDISRFNTARLGCKSGRVSWVQRRLGIDATGVFDDDTTTAVKAFQRQNHLVVDGIIGPKTAARLFWLPPPTR